MKSLPLLLLLGLVFISCSKESVKDSTADMVTNGLTAAIATSLNCADVGAVKTDVDAKVKEWFKQNAEKGLVQEICKSTVAELIPSLIGTAVPPTWKCSLSTLENAAEILSEMACKNITF